MTKAVESRFDSSRLDWRSYQLGVIAAFSEVVSLGCKRLALSSPMTEELFDEIIDEATLIAMDRGLTLYVDDDFLETRLFDPEHTRGKRVIHIASKRATIDEYEALREEKRRRVEKGTLTDDAETEIAQELGRLLSYSDEAIEKLLSRHHKGRT